MFGPGATAKLVLELLHEILKKLLGIRACFIDLDTSHLFNAWSMSYFMCLLMRLSDESMEGWTCQESICQPYLERSNPHDQDIWIVMNIKTWVRRLSMVKIAHDLGRWLGPQMQ